MINSLRITALGQVGFLFEYKNTKWLIDPYLSDYVENLYGEHLKRQVPIPFKPEELFGIDFIIITHEHEDHCDPLTLHKIFSSNPNSEIFCTRQCNQIIEHIPFRKVYNLKVSQSIKRNEVRINALPSCHTSIEIEDGYSRWMGFEFVMGGKNIYHPGDTIPFDGIIEFFPNGIHLAMLPINERNYFRQRDGIVGNMTCREAIKMAEELRIKQWIPTHWDMFKNNSTLINEMELIAKSQNCENHMWLEAGQSTEISIYG